jgi:hypothetical protein
VIETPKERQSRPAEDVRAARALRRRALLLGIPAIGCGALLLWHFSGAIHEPKALTGNDSDLALVHTVTLLRTLLGVGTLLAWGIGLYMMHVACRTLRDGRFPPPGVRVLRATPVLTGRRATAVAVVQMLLALFLISLMTLAFLLFPGALRSTPRDGPPSAAPANSAPAPRAAPSS